MNVVLLDGRIPIGGSGVLWRATEGEPAYRRVADLHDGDDLDGTRPAGVEQVWVGRQLRPGNLTAPPSAQVLLMVGHEPVDGFEDEFNDWMNDEHLPALGAVPGVLAARRYRAAGTGFPPYFALYHLTDETILASEAWKAAGSTPWARRMRELIRHRVRAVFGRAPGDG